MKNFKKILFPLLITLSALSVSASAAFYSVSGLSKLFAGASKEILIMASSLEIAKIVIASLLHQFWGTLNRLLKIYLSIAVFILVIITSVGVYGFLSAAYKQTSSELVIVENQKGYIQDKINFYQEDIIRYDKELETISDNIQLLSSAKVSQIQIRDTSSTTGYRNTVSTLEVRMAQQRINEEETNRREVQGKREIVVDSLEKYRGELLALENRAEQSGELGPLRYLADITGRPMDKIVNWLMLILIFVFDPLAVSLVLAANFAFSKAFPRKEKNLYGEDEIVKEKKKVEWEKVIEEPPPSVIPTDPVIPEDTKEFEENEQMKEFLNKKLENPSKEQKAEKEEPKKKKTPKDILKTLDKDPKKDKDWEVIDQEKGERQIIKILQKSPTKMRVLYDDGVEEWIPKEEGDDLKKVYFKSDL